MANSDAHSLLREGLQAFIGLPLSIARNAADMKVLHFGDVRPHESGKGTVGTHAIHIQCPWRIVSEDKVITGSGDLRRPSQEDGEVDEEDFRAGNLQSLRLAELMTGFDEATGSHVNATDILVVTAATTNAFGGAELSLSGGYRLQIFPDCSRDEDWRLVKVRASHIVVKGGKVYADD